MDKKYILGQFRYYVHHNNITIESEFDLNEVVNEFMCREGFYGIEVYDFLMEQKDMITA